MVGSINSAISLSMVEQIRSRQDATAVSIMGKQKKVVELYEEDLVDKSGEQVVKELKEHIAKTVLDYSVKAKAIIEQGVEVVGYPVVCNKTSLQLGMVQEWIGSKDDAFLGEIRQGKLHNALECRVDKESLPSLGSDSKTYFWGNENSSVSNVCLSLILDQHGRCTFPEVSDG